LQLLTANAPNSKNKTTTTTTTDNEDWGVHLWVSVDPGSVAIVGGWRSAGCASSALATHCISLMLC